MLFEHIILILVFLALLIGFIFWKFIKYYNYELNYKESLLYSIPILIISIFGLIDYSVIRQNLRWDYLIIIVSYFLIILLIYYILRFIKIKKYISCKSIIGYVIMSIVNLMVLLNFPTNKLSNISGWDMLELFLVYLIISIIFIVLLLIINIVFLTIKLATKNDNNFKNIKYKISKFSYINIFTIILLIIIVFMINSYNVYKYDKLIEEQKIVVINYLNKKYPNYEFEIIDTIEPEINCWMFGCKEQAFNNKILNKDSNRYFSILVKKEDLTIYEDEFQEIINEKIKGVE